ncbi:MAG TPA: GGDEF domain-containing protein [Deltaproteobacteria bacterium]|nr:GGDEF domain-containing protein [Deltaproteobacteria bacterium]
MKRWISFFIPGGILLGAALAMVGLEALRPLVLPIVRVAPPVILACAVLIGWRFNRSSLVFAALILALADRALLVWAPGFPFENDPGMIAYHAAALLLPLNLMMLSLMQERGFLTSRGAARMALIAVQPLAVMIFARTDPHALLRWLSYPVLPVTMPEWLLIHQPALLAFCLALLVVGVGFVRHQGAKESGFFWALAALLAALAAGFPAPDRVFLFSAAGLILLVSIIEASHAMAFKDELTGLPARRALKEDLLKLGNRYTLAMVDIDHFKRFNDRHGHDVGDQVLRMVAAKLSGVSGGGRAFRYGGEEFTVIFPGKYADQAQIHLEELRREVESSRFVIRSRKRPRRKPKRVKTGGRPGQAVSITVSIGMASRNEKHTKPQSVLKAADKALYRAKKQGRNRLCA